MDQEKKVIRRKKGPGLEQVVLLHIIADGMMPKSEINNLKDKVQGLDLKTGVNITIPKVLQESQKSSVKRIP